MILVTVGSQKFQFNRLLEEIDRLVEASFIKESIFAQIGHSTYKPRHYDFTNFVSAQDLKSLISKSNIIIAHAGTGIIMDALKQRKKVIVAPRLKRHGEHVDDHQLQIASELSNAGFIESAYKKSLQECLTDVYSKTYKTYHSNTDIFMQDITQFILENN